jgi:3-deoxy-manno-octulosonate cytidylyltransferase (CMP-KDO synthetase)
MNYTIIIPARYASTRFPGKPLAMLGDRTILQHVYDRAMESSAEHVIIATDDERIKEAAEAFGAVVCMTADHHASGTERLAEVVQQCHLEDDTVIVNLQGDEPFIASPTLDQVAGLLLQSAGYGMSTLAHVIDDPDEVADPHIVKVVLDGCGDALYFSRAPIPWDRDRHGGMAYYRHIGLYAYTAGFLRDYIAMTPCDLEKTEALEQLRVLYHGRKIKVGISHEETAIGIDTPEDLLKAERKLAG